MNSRFLLLAAAVAIAAAACKPSPETFTLEVRSGQTVSGDSGARSTTLVEGDVLVVGTTPLDDDYDAMNLCVKASSSAPERVEVRPVQGNCRLFVISAKQTGSATVSISARDGEEQLRIDVSALPEP